MAEKTKSLPAANAITEGVIWKQLLLFFFPILIGTFFQQLYNTVDTIIVGQYVGTAALAGVGTTGTLINLLLGFFIGLASGATVIIAQYFGASDPRNLSKAVHTAVALALAGGLILTAVGLLLSRPALGWMNIEDPEVFDNALVYLRIYFGGILFSVIYNVGTGILRAIGDSKMPLYVLIASCLVNIVLDLLFVVAFRWAVVGVALATVLSQAVSAVLVMLRLLLSREAYRVNLKEIRFEPAMLKNIVRIGLPAGFQSVLYSVSNLVIQASINSFGTTATASWAAISRLDGFVWMVMGAFSVSMSTFAGQNFGARKYDRLRRGNWVCLGLCMGLTVALSAVEILFAKPLLRIFTTDAAVVELAASFATIWAPAYALYVFIEIFSATIRGTGEALQPTIITLIGVCGLRLLWVAFVVPLWHQEQALAACYPVTWGVTAVVFILYYLRGNWLKRGIARIEAGVK